MRPEYRAELLFLWFRHCLITHTLMRDSLNAVLDISPNIGLDR